MKKTPTIFLRDFANNPKLVTREPNTECAWVFSGEGDATRKYDGTCCMYDGVNWFKRREVKPGKPVPDGFVEVNHDSNTGKLMGWLPVERSDKWHNEAILHAKNCNPGTFELCGPKIQGNPEGFDQHVLIAHADAERCEVPRDYDGLKRWLENTSYEGLVFHHPDGRMGKIKRRDFSFV